MPTGFRNHTGRPRGSRPKTRARAATGVFGHRMIPGAPAQRAGALPAQTTHATRYGYGLRVTAHYGTSTCAPPRATLWSAERGGEFVPLAAALAQCPSHWRLSAMSVTPRTVTSHKYESRVTTEGLLISRACSLYSSPPRARANAKRRRRRRFTARRRRGRRSRPSRARARARDRRCARSGPCT